MGPHMQLHGELHRFSASPAQLSMSLAHRPYLTPRLQGAGLLTLQPHSYILFLKIHPFCPSFLLALTTLCSFQVSNTETSSIATDPVQF